MRKVIAGWLSICLLMLASGLALAHAGQAVQEKSATEALEKQRAAAQEKHAAAKAMDDERRAKAKALAKERRAVEVEKRVLQQEKRKIEQAKRRASQEARQAARVVSEQRRAVERAIRQIARPEGTFKLLGSRLGIGRVVTGAPYSATAMTEHTQTLSDGNQIIQKNEAVYYRDSQGRTRIEQSLKTIGKWTTPGEPQRRIAIFDPVAGTHYSLDPSTRTALIAGGPQKGLKETKGLKEKSLEALKERQFSDGPKKIKEANALTERKQLSNSGEGSRTMVQKPSGQDQPVTVKDGSRERKKELLGSRVIEGVSAEGTRSTVTIPAGEIGNVSPIAIIDESWYSAELQVPLMTSHQDPRSGTTIYRLTNINRSEPARSLFEVPSDYRIVDKRVPKLPTRSELPRVPDASRKPSDSH